MRVSEAVIAVGVAVTYFFPWAGAVLIGVGALWRRVHHPEADETDPSAPEPPDEARNDPPTGFGFTNSRGSLLHVRHAIPEGPVSATKAVVLLLHGLGAHTSRRKYGKLAAELAKRGNACVMYDQEGHGRSGGLRSYIPDATLLVDDAQLLIELMTKGEDAGGDEERLGLSLEVRKRLKDVPLIVMGQSMGGSIATLLGLRLQEGYPSLNNFCGCILLCPALVATLPPAPVYYLLSKVVAPQFPKTRMPRIVDATCVYESVWIHDEDIKCIIADSGPGGLTSGKPMRYGTATALLAMLAEIQSNMLRVKFPFVVLHDPGDKVCKFEGSERMLAEVATPGTRKGLIEMPGLRHDLITNATEEVGERVCSWIDEARNHHAHELLHK